MGLVKFCALCVFVFCSAVWAQDAPAVEVSYSPLGIPCDPDQPNPDKSGILLPCEPIDRQGVLVFLRSSDETVKGFRTTVHYMTADGEEKFAVQQVAREDASEWATDAFRIGRIQTPTLSGITIISVDAEALMTLDEDTDGRR